MNGPEILIVDDDDVLREAFFRYLEKVGFRVRGADSMMAGREALQQGRFDALLLDLNLPDGNGLDAIVDLRESWPEMAIAVVTGAGDVPTAVEAMRRGADHFLTKPVNMRDLEVFLRKGLELGFLRREQAAAARLRSLAGPALLGEGEAMRPVREAALLAASADSPLLILGETGTGKGVLARWVHEHGPRRGGHFVDVNCSSLQGDLLASELFGHARGAFTSALTSRQGLLELAHRGTLFLDEVGDMSPPVQALFLKVLEEKRLRRLGENTTRASDFRVICATNRDLGEEVARGRFRKDLFFRLDVLSVTVPPLRDRLEDLPGLARELLAEMGAHGVSLGEEAEALLRGYSWPGNVRELRNLLERARLLSHGDTLTPSCFPGLTGVAPASGAGRRGAPGAEQIRGALARCGGRVPEAAKLLGISRATLYRRLKERAP